MMAKFHDIQGKSKALDIPGVICYDNGMSKSKSVSIVGQFFYLREMPDRFAVMVQLADGEDFEITSVGKEEEDAISVARTKVYAMCSAGLGYAQSLLRRRG